MTDQDTDRQQPVTGVTTAGTEREVLEFFLDFYRQVTKNKVRGLDEDQIRQRRVTSSTTLAGMLKHLAVAERSWFQRTLAQYGEKQIGALSHGSDERSWLVNDGETLDDLIAEYDEACAQSRAAAALFDLGHTVPHHRLGVVSLRWIYVHMIEETARHAGHADIIREQIDGVTGIGM
ncbi:MAG TPA: DinB family protein [Pseudonocardiaceae bacterium]|jgi:uncharacterized damage-inducible protein DinB|nr:DinB family protein [Pseudonocardiaceae bacterium]